MSDQSIECIECGRTFIWSYGEQRYYKERGLVRPKRCRVCRSRRRNVRDSGMHGFVGPSTEPSTSHLHRQKQLSWWANAVYRFGLVTFGLTIALVALISWAFSLDGLVSWLIIINLITLLTYGYDKAIAGSERSRVPERVLLALTLAGGTIGALAGMRRFHHKTAKGSFRLKFLLVALIQIAIIVIYYALIKS